MVLRKLGYDNDIKPAANLIPVLAKQNPEQSVELTNEAVDFLKGIFDSFDGRCPTICLQPPNGDFNNVFRRIVNATEQPHLSIPETEAGRNRKHYLKLIHRSLAIVLVGAAVGVVGLAAYRVYASRKNSSG
ncbi:hypothetical protein MLD38_035917 [Melastoma candidum]|uniref:Uncharacterized protein n=1 Tax=Melastoma candidum TaxID=119954 RepID=A0ACB9LIB9_9MYRT|nr:hypothetical protein MLD38_035917 [Melastoma candidum]